VCLTGMGLVRREVSEGVVRQEGWVHPRGRRTPAVWRAVGDGLAVGDEREAADKVNRRVTAPRMGGGGAPGV
jgi:hypothetical protein